MTKFVEGLRVAKVSGFSGHSHQEAFIEKVYKNGNFILKGDAEKKQWKPGYWNDSAIKVGDNSRFATHVVVWDVEFDKQIAADATLRAHKRRAFELEKTIREMRLEFLSEGDLIALEAAVNIIKEKQNV